MPPAWSTCPLSNMSTRLLSNLTRTPKPHGRSGRSPTLPYPPMSKANIIFLYFAAHNANCLYCPSVKLHCNTAFTNAAPHAVQASLFSSMSSPSSSLSLYPSCFRASFMIPPYETNLTPCIACTKARNVGMSMPSISSDFTAYLKVSTIAL